MIKFKHLKRTLPTLLLLVTGLYITDLTAQTHTADYFNVRPGIGKGIRFWSNNNYKIHLGTGANYHYGPVTDYSMKMNMNLNANRGWTWGVLGQTPIAALNTEGKFQTQHYIKTMERKYYFGNYQNLSGDNGAYLLWQSNNNNYTSMQFRDKQNTHYGSVFGSGNGAAFGLLDGNQNWSYKAQKGNYTAFLISNSEKMRILNNGNVGINTTTPEYNLEVNGTTKTLNFKFGVEGQQFLTGGGFGTYLQNNSSSKTALVLGDSNGTINGFLQGTNSGQKFGLADSQGNWSILAAKFSYTSFLISGNEKMRILNNGNVGIGTANPTHKLSVNGSIRAKEIKVESGWSDYVFYDDYDLPSLEEEEIFIEENGHLIGFESEEEMQGEISLGNVSKRQQAKIEEIILHLIDLKKELNSVKKENAHLKTLINNNSK